jgi:amino acid adenylation domain-containing protein/non-ribosomal peptide synthase protein (TIGR01720 family)
VQGLTLATLIQAAWAVIVGRASERRDVCFGIVVSGRPPTLPGVEQIVGLFVNTLPLRIALDARASLLELLHLVQEQQLRAREHEGLPLAELQRLAASTGVSLFDTLVVVQNYIVTTSHAAELEFSFGGLETFIKDNYTLTLALIPAHTLQVLLSWDRARLDRVAVVGLAEQLKALLVAMVADPTQPLAELERLTAGSRELLLAWNDTARPFTRTLDIPARVAAWAARQGDAIAIECAGEQLRYAELVARSNQLAHALVARGVGPEVRVGVLLERSLDMAVALLAVLAAGGAYVPLASDYPTERLRFMAADAGLALVITHSSVQGDRLVGIPALCLDHEPIDAHPTTAACPQVEPENLAYVIYTSGSTGRPKGVAVARLGLLNLVEQLAKIQPFAPARRALCYASIAFDGMVHELWGALANGATAVIATQDERLDPGRLTALLATLDTASLTPTVLAMLDPDALPTRFCMVVAGEACPHELATRWARRCTLINCYGPTEATVTAAFMRVGADYASATRPPPIGRPLANAKLYVLDERLDPAPIGIAGELYIAGVGLARGYIARPRMTAERFVPDPYGGPGERMYRTGDRGRMLADGCIELIGRIDHEVKLGGVRIDLGEVEASLVEHPAVAEAVVVVAASSRLIAHVVPRIDAAVLQAEHVAQWQTLNEQLYAAQELVGDASDEFSGWTSSYTGEPIPREQMREWVEATVAELRALAPRRVLELGCGSGLLLRRLAPHCEVYFGTDVAAEALARIRQLEAHNPALAHVQLAQAAADAPIPRGGFDLVVINSVVQYFPSVDYLLRVLDGAIEALAPGGTVFIGDVRNLALLEAMHASVALHRASDPLTRAELAERVARGLQDEPELLLDPAFFHAFQARSPRIEWVELRTKRGHHHNELSRFRYQALLHARGDPPTPAAPEVEWRDWSASALALARLGEYLAGERPPILAVAAIPDARLSTEVRALAWLAGDHDEPVAALRRTLLDRTGVDPEQLHQLGLEHHYRVALRSSEDPTQLEAVFVRDDLPRTRIPTRARPATQPCSAYANQPVRVQTLRSLPASLREWLQARLPSAMIPAAIIVHDSLPRMASGKLDRRALAAVDPLGERPQAAPHELPRTPLEVELASIWTEVLGIASVGIHANFFELGGDSISSIRVVGRAARAGIQISSRQLFQHPTIAGLASEASSLGTQPIGEQGLLEGEAPLSPIQRWFFAERFEAQHHANHAVSFVVPSSWTAAVISAGLVHVVERHDALRLGFSQQAGQWRAEHQPLPNTIPVEQLDLTRLHHHERAAALDREATQLHESMVLERAPLVRALLATEDERVQLVVIIHHLVVDAVSWMIVLEDLTLACTALARGQAPTRLAKTTAWASWTAAQLALVREGGLASRLPYWQATLAAGPTPLPIAERAATSPLESYAHTLLDPTTTKRLRETSHASGIELVELLVTGVVLVLREWSGGDVVGLRMEGHGREQDVLAERAAGFDLVRTVGWFTTLFPVAFELGGIDRDDRIAAIHAVVTQLRAMPDKGASYGMLRWLSDDGSALAMPERGFDLAFNYLGELRSGRAGLGSEAGPTGRWSAAANHLPAPLELGAQLVHDTLQLRVHWDGRCFTRLVIEGFLARYREMLTTFVGHHGGAVAGGGGLDLAFVEHAPLSFAQERIWKLQQREHFSVNTIELALRIRGPLDHEALLAAIALLVERHAALRTTIVEVEGRPCQRIMLPTWIEPRVKDLSRLDLAAREADMSLCLSKPLGSPGEPLTHIQLLVLGHDEVVLLIRIHHSLADGWSMGVLMNELRASYSSFAAGHAPELPPLPVRFAEHAAWEREHLSGRELERLLDHWRERLRGAAKLELPLDHPRPAPLGDRGAIVPIPPLASTDPLHALARAHATTVFNVLLATWQLVLAQLSGQTDIIVGTIVANRERWQLEHVIGCFINLVPLRTDLSGNPSFHELLARTTATTLDAFEHQATPFEAILDALAIPREPTRRPLVSVLFMLQNAPGADELDRTFGPGLTTEDLETQPQVSRFDLGLSLRLTPAGLRAFVRYSTELFEHATAERIARMYATLLARVLAHSEQPLANLLVGLS